MKYAIRIYWTNKLYNELPVKDSAIIESEFNIKGKEFGFDYDKARKFYDYLVARSKRLYNRGNYINLITRIELLLITSTYSDICDRFQI